MTTNQENNVYSAGITDTIYGGAFSEIASKLKAHSYDLTVCKGEHNKPIVALVNDTYDMTMPSIQVNARRMIDVDGTWWVLDLKLQFPPIWQEHNSRPETVNYFLGLWTAVANVATQLNEIKIPYID